MSDDDLLVDDSDELDPNDQSDMAGTLQGLNQTLGELVNPSTTEEAQSEARNILQDYRKGDPEEESIRGALSKRTDEVKELLKNARARIAARKFDPRQAWLAAAAGLGAPTRTGAISESVSNMASQLLPVRKEENEFNQGRDDTLIDYDKAIGSSNAQELQSRLQLLMKNQTNRAALAKEALKTLGKRVPTTTGKTAQALDKAYVKDYVDFIQGGAADAAKSLEQLGVVQKRLVGTPGHPPKDTLTGPVVGSIATLPGVGKAIQDITNPEAADTRELVESTIQQTLRAILGAQFTKEEGERLIQRAYNPRLEESVNAARIGRLISQLQRAYDQKKSAADYFEQHGTLSGFRGKTSWSIDEFDPEQDDMFNPAPKKAAQPKTVVGPAADDQSDVIEELHPKKRGFRWPWQMKFADGGAVQPNLKRRLLQMPDGKLVMVPDGMTDQEAIDTYQSDEPSLGTTLGESAVSGVLGGLGAAAGTNTVLKAADAMPGRRLKPGEKNLMDLFDWTDSSPVDLAARLKALQQKQVPAMLMDVAPPEVRGLGEASMLPKAEGVGSMLDELKDRQKDTRNRVADWVNRSLAPDPYQELTAKLTNDRTRRGQPLYQQAFSQFQAVKSPELNQILESPSGQKAVKGAVKAWQDKYGKKPFGKPDVTGAARSYNLEFLDLVKRQFDDLIGSAATSGKNDRARSLGSMRDLLRDALDKATTDPKTQTSPYQSARKQWESDSKLMEALQYGHDDFLKASPEEAADYVKNLDFTGRDVLRSGVAESLMRQLQGPYTDSNPAQKIVGSPDTMARMETLFDDPKKFTIFKEALEAEKDMFDDTRGTLNKGKASRGSYEPPQSLVQKVVREHAPTLGVFSPTYWALKRLRQGKTISDEEATNIIKILRTRDPHYIEKTLGSKFRRTQKRKSRSGKAGIAGAIAGAAAPFIFQGSDDDDEGDTLPEDVSEEDVKNPLYEGLTPAEIHGAKQPAKSMGGLTRIRQYVK